MTVMMVRPEFNFANAKKNVPCPAGSSAYRSRLTGLNFYDSVRPFPYLLVHESDHLVLYTVHIYVTKYLN